MAAFTAVAPAARPPLAASASFCCEGALHQPNRPPAMGGEANWVQAKPETHEATGGTAPGAAEVEEEASAESSFVGGSK